MSEDLNNAAPVYIDPRLAEGFEVPEFWCSRIVKVEFASAGVIRITFGTVKDGGRLEPTCSVLIPVENIQRSVDLLGGAAQQIASRSFICMNIDEVRATH